MKNEYNIHCPTYHATVKTQTTDCRNLLVPDRDAPGSKITLDINNL